MKKLLSFSIFFASIFLIDTINAIGSEEKKESHVLKYLHGKNITELQEIEATVEYPWIETSLGNILDVKSNGHMPIFCPLIAAEQKIMATYNLCKQLLNKNPVGIISYEETTEIKAEKGINGGLAYFKGLKGVELETGESIIGNHTFYSSQGNIDFIASIFEFSDCFAEVNPGTTVIKFIPHPSLNSPIEYLQIVPKKTPIFIQGKIDFRKLTFENFIVSHSEFFFKFAPLHSSKSVVKSALFPESEVKEIYKKALSYRDGKDGFSKDADKAKEIFSQIINLYGSHYRDEFAKAHHNIGNILYDEGSYVDAADYFRKSAALGIQQSQNNIWRMQIDQKIPASLTERFFAICDLNKYSIPFKRENFIFDLKINELINSGTMAGLSGIYAKTMNNSGLVSSLAIWVEEENGLIDTGKIKTSLLVVGKKRVI